MVRTQRFHRSGPGSFPGRGTKILKASWCGQKNKNKKKETGELLSIDHTFYMLGGLHLVNL